MLAENTAIEYLDGYKTDHRRQYPEGTLGVYSNMTARSVQYYPEAKDGAVVFGLQYFIKKYLIEDFNHFFSLPKEQAVKDYKELMDMYLGPDNQVGEEHIAALYDLGYVPLEIKALPEGSLCPIRVPMFTMKSTHKFFWITNYLETIMSNITWMPITSATTARLYLVELIKHAKKTGFYNPNDLSNLTFLCHDFSMRGMPGLEAAILSGMAHLTSFTGSETVPAIKPLIKYYNADPTKEIIAGTVPATEHSVMCAGGKEDELGTFERLITKVYPTGFISIVSDTWDFWKVVTEYLPALKEIIINRDGRVVIRPDSGDPVRIICGYTDEEVWRIKEFGGNLPSDTEIKGAYQLLWEEFGGTVNDKGYKVLASCIGLIYGDSITLERQKQIYTLLEKKGFAATNLVLGIGSFSYAYKSRDSLGMAVKATAVYREEGVVEIFKDPKTDSGVKKSNVGLMRVDKVNGKFVVTDRVSEEEEAKGELITVFKDGVLTREYNLKEIRENIYNTV